ncbi:DUF2637 domain-containing protein [Planomonospora parontospora]|uniref:DUF2637 domain-containing protein n=1 Tax=Planomonospora parontospora TaxID=58119 RepID=UPI00166FF65D|nr:DUF2637 domain-containing protein [Planomonospora parontospora]GGL22928.1 hypothetical protein GCM10014719_25980 [Planomonospora parontospora subsp. antibiotica]GII14962.1 hypothetical protein Ppa05_16880 [Planomonospora parontospora subsp. antibiotica]
MDVKSPAAAGPISRPSSALSSAPASPGRAAVALRHAGVALAGIGVAALTGTACVLSFETLRALAVTGGARADLSYLYPAGFDALLVITMIGVLLLRGARWPIRLQAGAVLVLLFAAVVAAEVVRAAGTAVDVRRAAVVVAVAPWAMLAVALWLWLVLIKHAHVRRAALDAHRTGPERDGDIVPFPEAGPEAADRPSARPVPHPAVETPLDPQAAPPLESAPLDPVPLHDLSTEPVVGPTPAPETPEVDELPGPGPAEDRPAGERGGEGEPDHMRDLAGAGEPARAGDPEHVEDVKRVEDPERVEEESADRPAGPSAAPRSETAAPGAPEPAPVPRDKPVRWGDLVRPHPGDLLVHPPRSAVRDPERDAVQDPEHGTVRDPEGGAVQDRRPGGGRTGERVETWTAAPHEEAEGSGTGLRPEAPPSVPGGPAGRDADTQPMRVMDDGSPAPGPAPDSDPDLGPDPAHGAEAADPQEDEVTAPPSGRMRSTPVPPEG